MKICIPKELNDVRVPMMPAVVAKLKKLGAEVEVEAGIGESLSIADADYEKQGAVIQKDRESLFKNADLLLALGKPSTESIALLKPNAIHVSYLDPFRERDLLQALANQKVSAIAMEMIPRTTKAQKMDALSSQASLGGYAAVLVGAQNSTKCFPMMMTPAGTIPPAKVFILGVGVAGLQAIATAKRLGARVEAFDTRPVVAEQVKSLGAKFVQIDLGETGQTSGGYAQALTEDQLAKQREGMKKILATSDLVITTAQVFGKPAPRLITADMLSVMKPGSVVVDMAVETGGNVEGSKVGEVVVKNGVKIVGMANLPGRVAYDASAMYASNLYALVEEFWNKETKAFTLKLEDEIMKGCLVTHGGQVLLK